MNEIPVKDIHTFKGQHTYFHSKLSHVLKIPSGTVGNLSSSQSLLAHRRPMYYLWLSISHRTQIHRCLYETISYTVRCTCISASAQRRHWISHAPSSYRAKIDTASLSSFHFAYREPVMMVLDNVIHNCTKSLFLLKSLILLTSWSLFLHSFIYLVPVILYSDLQF